MPIDLLPNYQKPQPKNLLEDKSASSNPYPHDLDEPGMFMSAVQGFNRPFEKLTYGAFSKIPGQIGQSAQRAGEQKAREYDLAAGANPLSTGIGETLGYVASELPAYLSGEYLASSALKAAPNIGRALEFVHKGLPKYAKNIAGAGLGGAISGGMKGLAGDEDALESAKSEAGLSSLIAGVLPPVAGVVKPIAAAIGDFSKGIAKAAFEKFNLSRLNPEQRKIYLAKSLLDGLTTGERMTAQKTQKLAQGEGLSLTPAEASGNAVLAGREAKIPKSAESEGVVNRFKTKQLDAQETAIDKFKKSLGNRSADVDIRFRDAAKAAIEKAKAARAKKAAPLYKAAGKDELSEKSMQKLLDDEVIRDAFLGVHKDKPYREALKNTNPYTVKYLDQVKKFMDAQAKKASGIEGRDQYKASIITASKNKLVNALDKVSPAYKAARKTFAEDSPEIQRLNETELGKIANMDDLQAKNVMSTIFDPKQANSKRIGQIQADLIAADPKNKKLWQSLNRENIERSLDTVHANTSETHGTNFYKQIANTDQKMKQLSAALSDNPEALAKAKTLKKIFKNLVNARTVKGQAGKHENNMQMPRNAVSNAMELFEKFFNKRKEADLVHLLTSGEWTDAFKKYDATGTPADILKKLSEFVNPKAEKAVGAIKKTYEKTPESVKKGIKETYNKRKTEYFINAASKKAYENSKDEYTGKK